MTKEEEDKATVKQLSHKTLYVVIVCMILTLGCLDTLSYASEIKILFANTNF